MYHDSLATRKFLLAQLNSRIGPGKVEVYVGGAAWLCSPDFRNIVSDIAFINEEICRFNESDVLSSGVFNRIIGHLDRLSWLQPIADITYGFLVDLNPSSHRLADVRAKAQAIRSEIMALSSAPTQPLALQLQAAAVSVAPRDATPVRATMEDPLLGGAKPTKFCCTVM